MSQTLYEKNEHLYDWIREKIFKDGFSLSDAIDSQPAVRVIQTADEINYKKILDISKAHNQAVCKYNGIDYLDYIGVIRGYYPHHAMYNRTKLLREMVDKNYNGWVLYLDADTIIQDIYYDFINMFSHLRWRKKSLFISQDGPNDEFFVFNDGVFAFDLSDPLVKKLTQVWDDIYGIYYNENDYKLATSWKSIVNDQEALSMIFRAFEERFSDKFISRITFGTFQSHWKLGWEISDKIDNLFFSALRADASGINSDMERAERAAAIERKIRIINQLKAS